MVDRHETDVMFFECNLGIDTNPIRVRRQRLQEGMHLNEYLFVSCHLSLHPLPISGLHLPDPYAGNENSGFVPGRQARERLRSESALQGG